MSGVTLRGCCRLLLWRGPLRVCRVASWPTTCRATILVALSDAGVPLAPVGSSLTATVVVLSHMHAMAPGQVITVVEDLQTSPKGTWCVCVRACACACQCACASVRACVFACVRMCVPACLLLRASFFVCV